MEFYREHLLMVAAVVFFGGLTFLRVVAKEKYRRERHLELRLAAKIKEQQDQEKKEQEDAAKRRHQDSSTSAPITLQPVS
jgi:hypothetical protein